MRGAFLKTVVALIVLLGLGGYVYWSDKQDAVKPKDQKAKVFTFDKAKVKAIRLEPRLQKGEAQSLDTGEPLPISEDETGRQGDRKGGIGRLGFPHFR